MHQKAFGGRAPPGPAGELKRSPKPLAVIWEPTSKGMERGGEGGRGRGKGMGREGKRGKWEEKGERG